VATILAIELLAASQALDLLAPLKTGCLAEEARLLVRRISARVIRDRPLSRDIARVSELVRIGEFADIVRP
jgi:histidine ammonia-lyase